MFFFPDYVYCSVTLDLVTCTTLLTSDDLIVFDVERPYFTRTLLKPNHALVDAWLNKRHNQVVFYFKCLIFWLVFLKRLFFCLLVLCYGVLI